MTSHENRDTGTRPKGSWTRRRAISLFAVSAGLAGAGLSAATDFIRDDKGVSLFRWQGRALGASANLLFAHERPGAATAIAERVVCEIERLERIFSLYRPDSALARLNGDGHLRQPPLELVELLSRARQWSLLTGGVFDVTVQPLWNLHRRAREGGAAPDARTLAAARSLIDYRALEIERSRIAFARPGMAVTLNGIAQGYVTDRVADLLSAEGLKDVLIDLGEIRTLGSHPDGRAWQIGLRPKTSALSSMGRLKMRDQAVASSGKTDAKDATNSHHFDPKTGAAVTSPRSVSVIAARATDADALSTALAVSDRLAFSPQVMSKMEIERILT